MLSAVSPLADTRVRAHAAMLAAELRHATTCVHPLNSTDVLIDDCIIRVHRHCIMLCLGASVGEVSELNRRIAWLNYKESEHKQRCERARAGVKYNEGDSHHSVLIN